MLLEILIGLEAAAASRTHLRLAVLVALDVRLIIVLAASPRLFST